MPAVSFSPILNAGQLFTAGGIPLARGLINTYQAGTSTPLATYTDSGGTTLSANPIVLDAGGFMTSELWLLSGSTYKIVITDSAGSNARSFDNITGAAANSGPLTGTSLTITGNAVLGDQTTDTFDAGAGGLVKDSLGRVYMASGTIGPNATNQHAIPAVTSDTFALLAAAQQLTNKGFGNVSNAGVTVLDWYEEGTFTPTLSFGFASTGITYGTNRGGSFTRIGNRICFELRVQLTSKGSSTGTARVSGLPYGSSSSSPGVSEFLFAVDGDSLVGLTGAPLGVCATSVSLFTLSQSSAVGSTALTDANFANASNVYVSGTYSTTT